MDIQNRSYIWLSPYFSVFSFTNCFTLFKISLGKASVVVFFFKLLIIELTLGVETEYFAMIFS